MQAPGRGATRMKAQASVADEMVETDDFSATKEEELQQLGMNAETAELSLDQVDISPQST